MTRGTRVVLNSPYGFLRRTGQDEKAVVLVKNGAQGSVRFSSMTEGVLVLFDEIAAVLSVPLHWLSPV